MGWITNLNFALRTKKATGLLWTATGCVSVSLAARAQLLADRSPVFRAMLEGPLAENRNRVINIRDVDPRAFEILVSFMTGDVVKFKVQIVTNKKIIIMVNVFG